ncbi:hypothetical protein ES703_122318 [subsurface metagenome]
MGKFEEITEKLGLTERMEEIQILASGFKAVDLEGIARFENELQVFDLQTHQIIRKNWEEKLIKNPKMFQGPLASIQDFKVIEGVLKFRLQRSRFDSYDGLRERLPVELDLSQPKLLDRDFCFPLSMGAVTVTAPDKENPTGTLIFGVRSKSTAYGAGNSTLLPAGYFNPDEDRILIGDPARQQWLMSIRLTCIREMMEEIGINDYSGFKYLGLIHDRVLAKQPLLAVKLSLDFTAKEMKVIAHDSGFETNSYHFIPNTIEAVRGFIAEYHLGPHSMGRLILYFARE